MNYIENYLSKKIKDFTRDNLVKEIQDILEKTFVYCNRHPQNKSLTISNFISDLTAFNSITIEDVKSALRSGMRGEYGDVIELSNAVLFKWVNFYINNQERKNQIDLFRKNNETVIAELTKEQIEQKNIENVINIFKNYKKGIKFHDFQGRIYDRLIKSGHILIDFNNFIDAAKKDRITEENKKVNSVLDLRNLKILLKAIEGGKDGLIVYKAKTLSIYEYFDNIENLEF